MEYVHRVISCIGMVASCLASLTSGHNEHDVTYHKQKTFLFSITVISQ